MVDTKGAAIPCGSKSTVKNEMVFDKIVRYVPCYYFAACLEACVAPVLIGFFT